MNPESKKHTKKTNSKQPYKAPKLTVFGSVSKLTAATKSSNARDGLGQKKT